MGLFSRCYLLTTHTRTNLRAILILSRVFWVKNLWIEEAWCIIRVLTCPSPSSFSLTSFSIPGRSDSLSQWPLHNTTQNPYCGAQKKHHGLPLSFVHSFFSLFKAENQSAVHTHTHTQDSLLFPSLCLFSSQWSFRLDMYCEKLSCSASFFFSFFHSLSLSTVCH